MNRRTIVISSAAGAVLVLGAAGAAVAAETSGGTPTQGASTAHHHHRGAFRGEYAQWTTYDAKTKADVVHDGIRGTVSAVSPTSITVKAKDGTSEEFAVASSTTVHVKGSAKGATGSIGQVKSGDRVEVLGTGKTSYAATRIDDRGAAASATPSAPATPKS